MIECAESMTGVPKTGGRKLQLIYEDQFSIAESAEQAREEEKEEKHRNLLSRSDDQKGSRSFAAGKGRKGKIAKSEKGRQDKVG